MSSRDAERFRKLRAKLFSMIKKQLEEDPYSKSYEGALEVKCEYPNYFEDENAEDLPYFYCITLHCYVLGPHRHYDFAGITMSGALDKFEQALNEWANGGEAGND